MATSDYMIVDGKGNFVAGPYKKGKGKRRLVEFPGDHDLVTYRPSVAMRKVPTQQTVTPEPTPEVVKKEEVVTDTRELKDVVDDQMKAFMEPVSWQFRSSTYSREEAANELIERLSLKDFEIVKVSKGWYINYNDTE